MKPGLLGRRGDTGQCPILSRSQGLGALSMELNNLPAVGCTLKSCKIRCKNGPSLGSPTI